MTVDAYYFIMADLDCVPNPFPREEYEAWARERIRRLGNEVVEFSYKRSMNSGVHATARLKNPISMDLIPIYQLAIGSDPKRECMNYFRFKYGVNINVLFGRKQPKRMKWTGKKCEGGWRFIRRHCPGLLELADLYKKELGLDLFERLF